VWRDDGRQDCNTREELCVDRGGRRKKPKGKETSIKEEDDLSVRRGELTEHMAPARGGLSSNWEKNFGEKASEL